MNKLIAMVIALGLTAPFAAPVFAQDTPTDQDSCEAAGMQWDADSGTCAPAD